MFIKDHDSTFPQNYEWNEVIWGQYISLVSDINARKLTCPKCSHDICFRCREDWHGYRTSCEEAAWGGSNADRIKFCPMCYGMIKRTQGCNHMRCLQCKYEFCYYCKDEVSSSFHWELGMGCGAPKIGNIAPRNRGICF